MKEGMIEIKGKRGVLRVEIGDERDFYREFTVCANLVVIASSEEEAIEKVKEGMIEDITIIDVLTGYWGG